MLLEIDRAEHDDTVEDVELCRGESVIEPVPVQVFAERFEQLLQAVAVLERGGPLGIDDVGTEGVVDTLISVHASENKSCNLNPALFRTHTLAPSMDAAYRS